MKIIAVTSCPSGVAHTYMSAEALKKSAKKRGHEIKVETQGSIGIENHLTEEDINTADIVILTKDTNLIGIERFDNKKFVKVGVSEVIKKADILLEKLEKIIDKI